MSEDPIGFSGGDKNLYRYVENNSIRYIDPHGESKLIDGIILAVGGIGLIWFLDKYVLPGLVEKLLVPDAHPKDPGPAKPSCNPEYQSCKKTEEPNQCSK